MGLGQPPREVRRGDPILARLFNGLLATVLRHRIVKVGRGLVMRQTQAGTTLALDLPPDRIRLARIASDHPQVPTAHATLTYDVALIGDGRTLSGLKPLNRMVRPDHVRKVIPARKGSVCLVIYPHAKKLAGAEAKHLLVFDEVIGEAPCNPPPQP